MSVQPAGAADIQDLPRRQGLLQVDADLDDWDGPCLQVDVSDPTLPAPLGNSAIVRLTWDPKFLWFAVSVLDNEVFPPPPGVEGTTLYQWDAFEIYLDTTARGSQSMDADDFQFILSCDGRFAALQGEPLIEKWEVPKRVRPGLLIETAARRHDWGFVIEGAIPLNSLGLVDPQPGHLMGLDLCLGDWLEDHPRLAELVINLDNLHGIAHDNEDSLDISDPDSTGWDGMLDWETRAYRPWSWSCNQEFGYPAFWHRVRLTGGPNLAEALLLRYGPWKLILAAVVLAVGLTGLVSILMRRRHLKRTEALLMRLAELEALIAAPATVEVIRNLEDALPAPEPVAPPVPDLIQRSLAYIQDNMQVNLNVADFAAGVGVSARTLQRALRDSLDCSPREVILASKMRHARTLLESGGWRVGEVAGHLGYESPYHFSRLFKNFYDKTPSSLIPPPDEG